MGSFTINITAAFDANETAGAEMFLARLRKAFATGDVSAPSALSITAVAPVPAPAVSAVNAPHIAQPAATVTEEAPASSEPSTPKRRGRPAGSKNAPKASDDDNRLPQPATPGATTAETAPVTPVAAPVASQAEETDDDLFPIPAPPAEEAKQLPPVPNVVTMEMLVKLCAKAFAKVNGQYMQVLKDFGIRNPKNDLKPEQYAKLYARLLSIVPQDAAA